MLDDLVRHLLDIPLHLGVCEFPSDETLRGEQGILWVYNSLPFRGDTDQPLALLCKRDDGRCGSATCEAVSMLFCLVSIDPILTLGVLDDTGLLALHDGDSGVGGTQVDTNDGTLHLVVTAACILPHKGRA